jgi:PhzF family phenazine biosynthesis protein
MARRRFMQCDVFSAEPARGNGLAVVLDVTGLSDADMQGFAAWTNLAETTFLFAPEHPEADYRVRIFSPALEMPFAGHPTLGSCAAWLKAGGVPKQAGLVRQECKIGIVEIDTTREVPAFIAPPTKIATLEPEALEAITAALDIAPDQVLRSARLDNGPVWQALELASAEDVLAVDSARVRWPKFKSIGLIGAHPPGSECSFEVRMLAPSSGMGEDPITGSLNSALAHWLQDQGRLGSGYVAAQGTVIGRLGRVYASPAANGRDILIGGETRILIEGTAEI